MVVSSDINIIPKDPPSASEANIPLKNFGKTKTFWQNVRHLSDLFLVRMLPFLSGAIHLFIFILHLFISMSKHHQVKDLPNVYKPSFGQSKFFDVLCLGSMGCKHGNGYQPAMTIQPSFINYISLIYDKHMKPRNILCNWWLNANNHQLSILYKLYLSKLCNHNQPQSARLFFLSHSCSTIQWQQAILYREVWDIHH